MKRGHSDLLKRDGRAAGARLRRLEPAVHLPPPSALGRLSEQDRQTLDRCVTRTSECLYDPSFRNADFRRMTPGSAVAHQQDASGDEALSRAEEAALFLRFNYCRHCVMRILRAHSNRRLPLRASRELIAWQGAAERFRARLVRNNIALVKAMARRFGSDLVEPAELESEGNLTLLRCVDKFDVARGYKFSTYACRAIRSSFSYRAACRARERKLAPVAYAPSFDPNDHLERRRERVEQDMVEELGEIIADNTAQLTHAEQRVLKARFPSKVFDGGPPNSKGWTLQRVGIALGFSKEKVRQIQFRALGKLRDVLDERLAHAERAAG